MPAEPLRYGLGVSNCRSARAVVSAATEAETLGAEIAFIAEDVNCRDAFQLCALSAGQTNRIRISTGVVNPYTRNPTSLAMAVATLDEVSAGRAQLGLGSSSPALIDDQMGIDSHGSVTVMREATAIVRMLLSGEAVTYNGERFRYRQAVLQVRPVQRSIPIYFAAMGPRMLRLAGALADGVLLNVGASTDYVRWAVRHVEEGAISAGRNPRDVTIAAWLAVYLDGGREGAAQRAREWLATMLSVPRQGELLLQHSGLDTSILSRIRVHYHAYPHGGNLQAAASHVPDEAVERMTVIGDVPHAHERLREYREAGVQVAVMAISALRALMS